MENIIIDFVAGIMVVAILSVAIVRGRNDSQTIQRLNGDIAQPFNDDEPSIPVAFTSSRWGSLASFGARSYPGTVRQYGTSGNSFVAVVEFGERVRALAVTAGGESGDPDSPFYRNLFDDWANDQFHPVFYSREKIEAATAMRIDIVPGS